MRIFFTILFMACLSASAQVINANPYYFTRTVSSGSDLLLDSFPSASAAWSLRKLDKDYAGSAIRVRRSSDNTEQDIGFTNGHLDTASLKSFVGSNDGFIVTWYDQSGNTRNITQATTTNQPVIILSGVVQRSAGHPTVYFNGDKVLQRSQFTSGASAATIYVVTKSDADPSTCNTCGAFVDNSNSGQSSHHPYSDGNIYDGWFSTSRPNTGNPTGSLTNTFLYCAISASNDWRSYINNVSFYTTVTNTTGSTGTFNVGSSSNNSFSYLGKISEIIIYTSASSNGDRTSISTNMNNYYSIY